MSRDETIKGLYLLMGGSFALGIFLISFVKDYKVGFPLICVGIGCALVLRLIFGEDVIKIGKIKNLIKRE